MNDKEKTRLEGATTDWAKKITSLYLNGVSRNDIVEQVPLPVEEIDAHINQLKEWHRRHPSHFKEAGYPPPEEKKK